MRTRLLNLRIPRRGNDTRSAEILIAEGRIAAIEPAGGEPAGDRQRNRR